MKYNFDQIIDRTHTSSTKWGKFPAGVLPMWVADMDFAAPEFILGALRERLEHPIIGYTDRPESLNIALQQWLQHHFGWDVPDEWIVWIPGVVPALNLAARTIDAGSSLMIPTPVYHPFLDLARHAGLQEIRVPMTDANGAAAGGQWEMDWDAMQDAIEPSTRMIAICNPQNPTGRCYTSAELNQLADFIERHDLTLVSDEIHCNLILDPKSRHIPIPAAHPEIAARTISLYAATKIYNIPGISSAAAVVPDAKLRQRLLDARDGLMPSIGPLGFVASQAAFNDRSDWIPQLLDYLRDNLTMLDNVLGDRLTPLQGTYLAWIDIQDLDISDPLNYFAEHKLGLSIGAQFGQPGYLRLNFACPRQTLQTGLARLTEAIAAKS